MPCCALCVNQRLNGRVKCMSKKEQKDILLIGQAPELVELYNRLKRPGRVLGVFADDLPDDLSCCPLLGTVAEASVYLESEVSVKRVYCSTTQIEITQVKQIHEACKVKAVKFCAVLPVVNELDAYFVPMKVGRQLLLTPCAEPLSKMYNICLKRIFDIILSLFLLVTLFPVVYLVRYIGVKRQHLGSVIRAQHCVGPDGKHFRRWTFRTANEVERGLDVLPELLNVFIGNMSMVGPACMPVVQGETVPRPHIKRRFVKSGIVGKSQISKHEGNSVLKDDIWYVENWSLWKDICILFRSMYA